MPYFTFGQSRHRDLFPISKKIFLIKEVWIGHDCIQALYSEGQFSFIQNRGDWISIPCFCCKIDIRDYNRYCSKKRITIQGKHQDRKETYMIETNLDRQNMG